MVGLHIHRMLSLVDEDIPDDSTPTGKMQSLVGPRELRLTDNNLCIP